VSEPAGIDAGKTHRHCVAIDECGGRLLLRRVANDGPELLEFLADVVALGDEVAWGIRFGRRPSALTSPVPRPWPAISMSGCRGRTTRPWPCAGRSDGRVTGVTPEWIGWGCGA